MNDPILLRRRVRMILSALPPGKNAQRSEKFLYDMLEPDFTDLKVAELAEAISWNQAAGYISYRYNKDQSRTEWFLTDEGRHKEGLA